jgi:hypothetical protein
MSFSSNRKPSNHYINPSIFTHCRFQAIVATAVAETYLHHARIDQDNLDIEEGLRHIGRLIQKLSDCNELDLEIALNGNNNMNSELRTLHHRELYSIVDELPDPDNLNLIELSCSADTFLEVLMGNIRNALISFQAWAQKCSQAKASRIINSLNRLETDYKNNCDLIAGFENELTTIREEELSVKIRELKIFEHLHNEKPSPLFLTLLKSNNDDDLKGIKNSNGTSFSSDQERHNFIHEFFQEIYTPKHTGQQVDYNTCIFDFLGLDIANHPVVTGSKLTVQEREELDSPLTVAELDQSLRDCNLKSAAGSDGLTNKLIKL